MSINIHNGHKPNESPDLTIKQARLIELLIAGSTIVGAAATLQVNESTARRWLKLPHVEEVYRSAKDDLVNQVLSALHKQGLATLKRHITADLEPTAASQIQAIRLVTEEIRLNIELAEIKQQIAAFQAEIVRGGY